MSAAELADRQLALMAELSVRSRFIKNKFGNHLSSWTLNESPFAVSQVNFFKKLNYLLGITSLTRVLFNQGMRFLFIRIPAIFSCPNWWDSVLNERLFDV